MTFLSRRRHRWIRLSSESLQNRGCTVDPKKTEVESYTTSRIVLISTYKNFPPTDFRFPTQRKISALLHRNHTSEADHGKRRVSAAIDW
jgi:hypothetical protein